MFQRNRRDKSICGPLNNISWNMWAGKNIPSHKKYEIRLLAVPEDSWVVISQFPIITMNLSIYLILSIYLSVYLSIYLYIYICYINYNYNSIWFKTNMINNYKTPTKQTASGPNWSP